MANLWPRWTPYEVRILTDMAALGFSCRAASKRIGRTVRACSQKASRQDISFGSVRLAPAIKFLERGGVAQRETITTGDGGSFERWTPANRSGKPILDADFMNRCLAADLIETTLDCDFLFVSKGPFNGE